MNSYNPFSLQNKTILITGASSGIGRAVAVECAKLGARCVLTARNNERLQQTLSELEGVGHSCMVADLKKEDEIDVLVKQLPQLEGLVLCAGVSKRVPLAFYSQEKINDMFGTNVFAPMLLLKAIVKAKKLVRASSVVFVASIGGVYSITNGSGIYGASKSALNAYMKYAALELSAKGIRCNAVNPGMVNTPLVESSQEEIEKDLQNYPLKRYGEPTDIAWAVIYLLSDAASWVTGTELKIDGGRTLK